MKRLQVESMGDDAQGVRLRGDRRSPEPIHFRVSFPGGDVEIVRASEGDGAGYWVHVRVNDKPELEAGEVHGRLADARLDVRSMHASETSAGDFANPGLYHVALRIQQGPAPDLPPAAPPQASPGRRRKPA